jgi:Ala-tRNA(Pro) deacylase
VIKMNNREKVLQALDKMGIEYEFFTHGAANTMEDCETIDKQMGIEALHCKNLFLANRQGSSHYLLLTVADKPFKTADVSKQMGVSRLSFGKEDKLLAYLGTTPGAVTPLGLIFDTDKNVMLVMDKDLLSSETIVLHPCENTSSVVLRVSDFMEKFIKPLGYSPIYVTIKSEEGQS